MTAPRPALAAVKAARAISSGQAGPGSAIQAARAGRPAASASRNDWPAGDLAQGPGSGRGGRSRPPSPPLGRLSAVACALVACALVACAAVVFLAAAFVAGASLAGGGGG